MLQDLVLTLLRSMSPPQTGLLFAVSLVMLVMFYKPGACPTTILQLTYRNAVVCILNLISLGAAAMHPLVPVHCIILFHKLPLLLCPQYGVREEYCDEHVCLFVCPRSYLQNHTSALRQFFLHVTYGHGSVRLWRRSDMLRISGLLMTSYLHIS